MTRTNKNDRIQNLTDPLPIKRKEKKEKKTLYISGKRARERENRN